MIGNKNTVLFLCTANIFRSQVAEQMFNRQSQRQRSVWQAQSRGLAVETLPWQMIHRPDGFKVREPTALTLPDLSSASLVIAMHEPEHRPLMERCFPNWEDKIAYWQVGSLGQCRTEDVLDRIAVEIAGLIEDLELHWVPEREEDVTTPKRVIKSHALSRHAVAKLLPGANHGPGVLPLFDTPALRHRFEAT